MGQGNYIWIITFIDGTNIKVVSTQEDLPNVVDFGGSPIISIVRLGHAAEGGER